MKMSMLYVLVVSAIFLDQGYTQEVYPEVPRIDATMAYYMYKQGSVVLIDAMGPTTFAQKHILGSINIPNDGPQDLERVRNMDLPFPKEKIILVYCM
jgi:rhodanese-related sulfurtransferase